MEYSEKNAMPPISFEPSEDALLNVELYDNYSASQENWAVEATECEEFLHNVHLTREQAEELEKRGQSPMPVNVV